MVIMGGRGQEPETCPNALRKVLVQTGNRTTAQTLFEQVKKLGHWTDAAIWQTILSHTINCPPSYHLYGMVTAAQRFLFLREDGNYEFYDRDWHGHFEMGKRVV
jgi:hypothetical protein